MSHSTATDSNRVKGIGKILSLVLGGIITLLLICGGAVYWVSSFNGLCTNEVVSTAVSPSGNLKAVLFHRDCGATTHSSTHISILPASASLPKEAGNVFVQDEEPIVAVRWLDDRHLSISRSEAGKVFRQLADFRGVRVIYE